LPQVIEVANAARGGRPRARSMAGRKPCSVTGCWSLHGAHLDYYFDTDAQSHVLEVWPVGIEEPEEHQGNGEHRRDRGQLNEPTEFDFTELSKESNWSISISANEGHFSISVGTKTETISRFAYTSFQSDSPMNFDDSMLPSTLPCCGQTLAPPARFTG
jgi:hypothetical protein